jgi:molybdate transport system substrate-binding protein
LRAGAALAVLSAGAAKAVVLSLADELAARDGLRVDATFDAAGAIRARFLAGDPCDVVVLPAAMLDALADEMRIDGATIAALGRVATAMAVPQGAPLPAIVDAGVLREALAHASALYCPDIERSTAGIHFVRMLRDLGIHPSVASRLRPYGNGAQAMAAMVADAVAGAIGCTQASEILYTPGAMLVGPLPPPFELATLYAAAVAANSGHGSARTFVEHLTAPASRASRIARGFGN